MSVIEVVHGWRTYPDGSCSHVERWVKHADGDWISLDSSRRTSGDIFMCLDAGVNAGPDVPTALPGSEAAGDVADEAKGPEGIPAPASPHAVLEAIVALTWFPSVRDAVSGRTSPPRRKTHVRVRDIDAALATALTDRDQAAWAPDRHTDEAVDQ